MGLKEGQGEYLNAVLAAIDAAGAQGFPNVIVTAGTRDRVTSGVGTDNTVDFLNKAKARAEEKGVTLCMEILNSMGIAAPKNSLFDHAPWGWEVCRRVNSRSVKVLYDIWHAQLMDGNIAETIRDNIQWIGHIHTGGVPGRHEIFRNDELDYRFLAQVIAGAGFGGFVTHEWNPSPGSDVADDLRRSVQTMTV
jgi:hydroxypyruvate isomerase